MIKLDSNQENNDQVRFKSYIYNFFNLVREIIMSIKEEFGKE